MECESKKRRLWYAANPEEARRRNATRYAARRESTNASILEAHRRDPRKRLVTYAKQRAKKAGVPFAITIDDIEVPLRCPALGIELRVADRAYHDACSPSLDRVIPALGYVPGNVQVISFRANEIKNSATAEELEMIAAYVRKHTPKV